MPRSLHPSPPFFELPPFLNPTSPDFLHWRPARRPVRLSRASQKALLELSSHDLALTNGFNTYLRKTKLKPGTYEVGIRNRVMGRLSLPVSLNPNSRRKPKFRPARSVQRLAPQLVVYIEHLGQHLSGERNWAHTDFLDIEDFVREHDKNTWSS